MTDTGMPGGFYYQHPTQDVAVFRMNGLFAVNGSTLGHALPLWGGIRSNLNGQVGQSHPMEGFGVNDCNGAQDSLRSYVPTLNYTSSPDISNDPGRYFGYNPVGPQPPSNQQAAAGGDSGSSFRWNNNSFQSIMGTLSFADIAGDFVCTTTAWAAKVSEFRPWAHLKIDTMYSYDLGGFFQDTFDGQSPFDPFSWTINSQNCSPFDIAGSTGGPGSWFAQNSAVVQQSGITAGGTVAIDSRIVMSNGEVLSHIYSNPGTSGFAGLVFRYVNNCNFYYFQLDAAGGKAYITRKKECSNTNLKVVNFLFDWNNNGNGHLIGFLPVGNRLTGFVDGTPIIDVYDNSDALHGWLTAGKTGFFASAFGSTHAVQFLEITDQFIGYEETP